MMRQSPGLTVPTDPAATPPADGAMVSPANNPPAAAPVEEATAATESHRPARRRRTPVLAVAVVGIIILAVGATAVLINVRRRSRVHGATRPVHREVISRSITVRGDLEAIDSTNIICRVQSLNPNATNSTTIRWIIDDGTMVHRGQLLAELDDSPFREALKTQKVARDLAWSDMVQADENLKIVRSQNESDIKTAEVALRVAEIDLEKYVKGDYEQARKALEGQLAEAETNVKMWEERVGWSSRMVRRKFTTRAQARAEQEKLQSAELAVKNAREALRVLDRFTFVRMRTEYEGKADEARRALDRVRKQAVAKETLAAADRLAKEHIYREREQQCLDTEEQIQNCRIYAPHEGMAIYYVSTQSRHGTGAQQSIVAQGEPVREGQILIRLPDLSRMAVRVRLHEAVGGRVRAEVWEPTGFGECLQAARLLAGDPFTCLLGERGFAELRPRFHYLEQRKVSDGQPALVRVGAAAGRALHGHVRHIANVLTQESHWIDVKTYEAQIAIDETMENLRPDLSAEVTILDQANPQPVLAVPLQAVVHTADNGNHGTCFVMTPDGPEPRNVIVGVQNGELAEICAGLEEGEEVVLDPRALTNGHTDVSAD